jgi:hypothetical protein
MRAENKHLALKVRTLPAEADGYLLLMCRAAQGETNEILATLVLPGQRPEPVHFRFFLGPEMRSFLGPFEDQREAILPKHAGDPPNGSSNSSTS